MATCLCCMFDPTNNPNSFNLGGSQCNYRTPPSWGPERDAQYPFRAYCLDVRLWTMVTDLPPRQQGAALIMRLTGAAKHSTRTLSPDEIYNGGVVRGRRLEPIGYILAGLSMRYAQLGDETRLAAMIEYQNFHRKQNETINAFLDRYDTVRYRGETEGNFVQSIEACALQMLRCLHLSTKQIMD